MIHNMAQADTSARTVETEQMETLTDFQQCILHILKERSKYGLRIKRELGDYFGEEVNHGRLYPNLDQLVDAGLVEKSERDRRTNDYSITEEGREWLKIRRKWETALNGDSEDA